jgi:hypothetical protein
MLSNRLNQKTMKYSLLLFFLITTSCHSKNLDTENLNETPQITIEYLNLINGYKVKILWIPNKIASNENEKIVGPAILELKKNDGKTFYANFTNFSIDITIPNLKMNNEFVQSFTPIYIQRKFNIEKDPFFFEDVNFDNSKELIISETGFFDFDRKVYRIFEIIENSDFRNNTLDELNEEAFLSYGNTTFDKENKEIIVVEYNGCCEYDQSYYKLRDKLAKNSFFYYKTENHLTDYNTNKETITVYEKEKVISVKVVEAKKQEE